MITMSDDIMRVTCDFILFKDLMNREKRDQIPSMQVSFIDAICTQLYEVNVHLRSFGIKQLLLVTCKYGSSAPQILK